MRVPELGERVAVRDEVTHRWCAGRVVQVRRGLALVRARLRWHSVPLRLVRRVYVVEGRA